MQQNYRSNVGGKSADFYQNSKLSEHG